MSFSVKIGRESKVWSIADVENKLRQLSQVDKKHYWIRKDLSVRKSGRIGRLFWTVIAKRVKWMRRLFYGVDLERSKSILKQLKPQIKTSSNQTISTLFRKATQQFNAISPKHKVDLDETPQGDGSPPGPGSAPQGGGSPPQQGGDLKEYLSSTRRTLTRRKSQEFLFKGIEELHEKMQDFEKNHKEILSLSAKSLVSLSSSSNFETKTSKAFPPLDGNGNPEKYSYFSNALLSEMTKLRLALPACLIRGLESENPEIKKAAIEEFRQLVKGYFEKTIHSTHHKPFFNVLLVLSRALYDSYEEKSEAEQLLLEIWASSGKGRRRILRRLTQQPYNIRPRSEEMRKAINRRTRKKGKA
ncbi:MAG: hypothetical protein ACE5GN_07630, partial [Waddliaceae bacterium]